MSNINKLLEKEVNGLKVNLFEYNTESEESIKQIREYLINKVKISKVYSMAEYDLTYYGKNLDPKFISKFNEEVNKICIPKKHSISQFDVRRERVTEWIAQYLLEHEYDCKFFDEADKRVNLDPVEVDKHTDGIDVPGIWFDDNIIRFVVCEVKASEEITIPCSSATALQNDIQKAIDNVDNRVTREILTYVLGIKNITNDKLTNKIIIFLSSLIAGEKKDLAEKIMFFPFFLRNNKRIVSEKNINDYENFSLQKVKKENVESIILAFNKNFSDFSNNIYEEAVGK